VGSDGFAQRFEREEVRMSAGGRPHYRWAEGKCGERRDGAPRADLEERRSA
jgi:hypothetical protein